MGSCEASPRAWEGWGASGVGWGRGPGKGRESSLTAQQFLTGAPRHPGQDPSPHSAFTGGWREENHCTRPRVCKETLHLILFTDCPHTKGSAAETPVHPCSGRRGRTSEIAAAGAAAMPKM